MSESIEFSEFFRLLNEIKEGEEGKEKVLEEKMKEYQTADNSSSFLDELGKRFIYLGMTNLYQYAGNKDLISLTKLDKKKWEELSDKNEGNLPQYLANRMITSAKDNKTPDELANKWKVGKREVNKHIRPMAQYITEGLIEFLE